MPPRTDHLRGLYAVTDAALTPGEALVPAVRAALAGGARVVQYRDKGDDAGRREREARALLAECREVGVPLIVNDDVELAWRVGADGVHLGRDDADPAPARERLGPRAVIGVSCYNSIDRARAFQARGVSYVAFGSVYPSPTKPDAVRAGVEIIERARADLQIPIAAIGGITAGNAAPLVHAGADLLAVIHDVFGARDIEAAARRLASLFDD